MCVCVCDREMRRKWDLRDLQCVATQLHLPVSSSHASISPLKDGLAWIRIGTCSKLTHNNPVGSHVPTISFAMQVATLVCDPTCGCCEKGVIKQDCMMMSFYVKWCHLLYKKHSQARGSNRHPVWRHICEYHAPPTNLLCLQTRASMKARLLSYTAF